MPDKEALSPDAIINVMGEEIYSIFCEEVEEINAYLQAHYPMWASDETQADLLADIRRSFHTLKGSGRMAGAQALGEFGWAHENLLNKVIARDIPVTPCVKRLLQHAVNTLQARRVFLTRSTVVDSLTQNDIDRVNAYVAGEPIGWPEDSSAHSELVVPNLSQEVPQKVAAPMMLVGAVSLLAQDSVSPDTTSVVVPDEVSAVVMGAASDIRIETPETDQSVWAEDDMSIVLQLFWEELPERLQAIDQTMLDLQQSTNQASIRQLERELHTLKGGARMAQMDDVAAITHKAETELANLIRFHGDALDADKLNDLQGYIDQIHDTVDLLGYGSEHVSAAVSEVKVLDEVDASSFNVEQELAQHRQSFPVAPVATQDEKQYSSLLENLLSQHEGDLTAVTLPGEFEEAIISPNATDERQQGSSIQDLVRLPTVFLDRVIERSSTTNVLQNQVSERMHGMSVDVGELGRTVARLRQLLRAMELETEAKVYSGNQVHAAPESAEGFDPLEMDEYSELQRLSRSLAESLNDLINIEGDLIEHLRKAEQGLGESIQAGRKTYQDLLSTRLVALNILLPRLNRVVRQTANELGKSVALHVSGEDSELDRQLLQRLIAPLEHLLRNAIAHGIESEEQRLLLGKPTQGAINLTVRREDADIVLVLEDDGAGFDRDALRDIAIAKGLLKQGEAIDAEKLDRMILQPGFTTATNIDQISGRGVGMDVVYSEVKSVGGSLRVSSTTGKGASFELRVPFTMAANPVLFTHVQKQTFALPMGIVRSLMRFSGEEVQERLNNKHSAIEFEGSQYPVRYLGQAMKLRSLSEVKLDEMYSVILTQAHGLEKAWVVDGIVGRQDAVMQPLGQLFKSCSLYSAATITSDGRVVLLPDTHELLSHELPDQAASRRKQWTRRANDKYQVMVVDDSITVRKVTEKLLLSKRFQVRTAKDGMEALELIRDFKPDIMLLDIEMPRMDGFELLKHLRSNDDWKTLPVIMISSRTAEKHRSYAQALGASDFLGKPYQDQALLGKISQLLKTESSES